MTIVYRFYKSTYARSLTLSEHARSGKADSGASEVFYFGPQTRLKHIKELS